MLRLSILMLVGAFLTGCQTPQAPQMPAGPELVGKVKSQPGNCYYRDPTGKLFVSPCK